MKIEKYYPAPFDWSSVIRPIDADHSPEHQAGHQILHFCSQDKDCTQNPEMQDFLNGPLSHATPFEIDAELIRYACDQIELDGIIAEMGVCTGRTINFIAALNPGTTLYGFDSFAGLPEDWHRGDIDCPKGLFAWHDAGQVPPVLHNVQLIKGLFSETLPVFAEEILQDQPIAFLHIDCDIYQSTCDIFDAIGHRLVPGSVVLFDELYNYPGWQNHEWRALQEFLKTSGKNVEYLAYNRFHEQVVVRFTG